MQRHVVTNCKRWKQESADKVDDCEVEYFLKSKPNKIVKNNHQKKDYVKVKSNQILTYL